MWLDFFPNDGRRMMCQVKDCDHQASVLHAEMIHDGYRLYCTALCMDHAERSLDRSKPVLQLTPIRMVEQEAAAQEVSA